MKLKGRKTSNRLLSKPSGSVDTLCYRLRKHLNNPPKVVMSQAQFAKLLGVHKETIGAIERGRKPSPLVDRELKRLAKKHGMEID